MTPKPRQLTGSRAAVLFSIGILTCYVALIAAAFVNPLVDKVAGTPRFFVREISPEEENRATTVQLSALGCAFLFLSFVLSRFFLARSHSLALWLANPLSIAAGVFLLSHFWPWVFPFPELGDQFWDRTRAFFVPQGNQLQRLYWGAILISLLTSWFGAWLASRGNATSTAPKRGQHLQE